MNQLVFIQDGKTVTDSLTVAEVFGKRHSDVLRSIDNLECSAEFNERNFASVDYIDAKGQHRRKVIMNQDGFSFLVMGYTGKEAARFKEMYIRAFNQMREQLNRPADPLKALMQATHNLLASQEMIVERLDGVEQKVDSQITLDSGQQRRLQKAISQKVYSLVSDREERSELYRQLHRDIKDRWGVPSYKDVLRHELQEVLNFIDAWKPIRKAG